MTVFILFWLNILTPHPLGQPQPAATQAGPASTPVTAAQRAAGAAPGQSPVASSQPNRPQQGQVKLTMAQLMQLTQGAQVRAHSFFSKCPLPPQ